MFRLLLLLVVYVDFNLLMVKANSRNADRSINKLNYGLSFEFLDQLHVVTAIQKHTIKIVLPTHKFDEELNLESGSSVTGTLYS